MEVMNHTPQRWSIGYFVTAVILVMILAVMLACDSYFRLKLGYAMIIVGATMLVVSMLAGGLGVAFTLRAYCREEPIGLWLFSTSLAFVPAITYIFLVAKPFFP